MNLGLSSLSLAFVMDVLAFGASAVLIIFLIANRRRYGRLVAASSAKMDFGSQMTLEMFSQQSRRSYARLQQTLNQEFASLQRLAGAKPTGLASGDHARNPVDAFVSLKHAGRYDEACRMIHNGADRQVIAERCGLSHGEIDLMAYMQQKRT